MDGVTTCIVAAVSRFFQLCDKFDLAIDALDELQNVLPIEMRRRVAGDAHPVCFFAALAHMAPAAPAPEDRCSCMTWGHVRLRK